MPILVVKFFTFPKNQKLTLFKDFSKSSADGLISFSIDKFPEIYVATDKGYEVINFYSTKKSPSIKDKYYFQEFKKEGFRFLEKPYQIVFNNNKLNLLTGEKVFEFDKDTSKVITTINKNIIRAPYVTVHDDQSATLIFNTESNTVLKDGVRISLMNII